MKRPSKQVLYSAIAVAVLALAIIAGFYFRQKSGVEGPRQDYVDSVTKFVDVSKQNQEDFSNRAIQQDKTVSQKDFDKTDAALTSYVRTVCVSLPSKDTVIDTPLFRSVKSKFDQARDGIYKDNQEIFRYNRISRIVSAACPGKGSDYVDLVINYLQYEGILRPNPNARENLGKFLTNMPQTFPKVQSGALASDAAFNQYFFEENRSQVLAYYFPYYEMTKADPDTFFGKPLDTLEQSVAVKKDGITKFNKALATLGMDIGTFRQRVQKISGVLDKDGVIQLLKKDYDALIAADPKLEEDLSNVTKFEAFVRTGGVEKLKADPKTSVLYEKVIMDMTYFLMLSEDWAGGVYETWS